MYPDICHHTASIISTEFVLINANPGKEYQGKYQYCTNTTENNKSALKLQILSLFNSVGIFIILLTSSSSLTHHFQCCLSRFILSQYMLTSLLYNDLFPPLLESTVMIGRVALCTTPFLILSSLNKSVSDVIFGRNES